MNRRTFLASAACSGAVFTRRASGASKLSYDCDVDQGINFKTYVASTFGYINTLTLSNYAISPDILINEPDAPPAGGGTANPGVFREPVVAVLSTAAWSTLRTDVITLHGRISPANASKLKTLLPGLKNVVVAISFVVYAFDPINKAFYPAFSSYAGSNPNGSSAPPKGASQVYSPNPIYSGLAQASFSDAAMTDGIQTYGLALTLSPLNAPAWQQLLFQPSQTAKTIEPWGSILQAS